MPIGLIIGNDFISKIVTVSISVQIIIIITNPRPIFPTASCGFNFPIK